MEMKQFLHLCFMFSSAIRSLGRGLQEIVLNSFIASFKCSKKRKKTHSGIKKGKVEMKDFLHLCFKVSFYFKSLGRGVQEIVLNSFIASFKSSKTRKKLTEV